MVVMWRAVALVSATMLMPALSGCAALTGDDSGKPSVVAAFYPYAWVAQQVAGTHADVINLTQPGLEPHDLELTPRQVGDLSIADLVIYEQGFQPSVDEAVDQNAEGRTLDVTDVVPLEDTGAPVENGEDLSGDPHLWQDPTLLAHVVAQVEKDLVAIDPTHAAAYRRNADRLTVELNQLDQDFTDGLAHCERREFVTSHAAFGYLAARYGLSQEGIAGVTPDAEPDAATLRDLAAHVEQHGVTTVYSEALVDPALAETLARETGARVAVLDPLEGLTDRSRGRDYLEVMRSNLAVLEQGQGCS
jgi:zinc transport system substrate-binding protein